MTERVLLIEMEAVPPRTPDTNESDLSMQYLIGVRDSNFKAPKEILGGGLEFVSSQFGIAGTAPGPGGGDLVMPQRLAVWTHDFEVAARFNGVDRIVNKLLHIGSLMPDSHWHRIHVREIVRPGWALGKRIF
jgi:hypothetical protein